MTANMAQECRTLASVDNSATTLQTNVNVGGHVWQHVYNIHHQLILKTEKLCLLTSIPSEMPGHHLRA